MNNIDIDKEFVLNIDAKQKLISYLSVSWQPGKGKDFGYKVIQKLDEKGVLVIGDTKGHPKMEKPRMQRIMSQADCFISILPFRPDSKSKTSSYMLEELNCVIELNLPIIIIYDSRIPVTFRTEGDKKVFIFEDLSIIEIPEDSIAWYNHFDFGVEKSEETELINFIDALFKVKSSVIKSQPYAFLICRLQPDFGLPRFACKAAAEIATGIPCIWIDSNNYKSNIDDTTERARLLIKNAAFVIAEISLTDDNVEVDNPSRAHEIGLATAYLKKVFLVSHTPRRNLYHGLVTRQLIWWENETGLFEDLKTTIYNERSEIGRHVYNYELKQMTGNSQLTFTEPIFNQQVFTPWTPPIDERSSTSQSWIYAISIGLIVGCVSYLLTKMNGYDQTLDLVAIFAGVITFFFSSNVNKKIQKKLIQISYLKWLIPLIAFVLFIISITYNIWHQAKSPALVRGTRTISYTRASSEISKVIM